MTCNPKVASFWVIGSMLSGSTIPAGAINPTVSPGFRRGGFMVLRDAIARDIGNWDAIAATPNVLINLRRLMVKSFRFWCLLVGQKPYLDLALLH